MWSSHDRLSRCDVQDGQLSTLKVDVCSCRRNSSCDTSRRQAGPSQSLTLTFPFDLSLTSSCPQSALRSSPTRTRSCPFLSTPPNSPRTKTYRPTRARLSRTSPSSPPSPSLSPPRPNFARSAPSSSRPSRRCTRVVSRPRSRSSGAHSSRSRGCRT